MRRPLGLVLVSLTLFLVILPLAVGKPGLPMTLKADEPAYYLMALSLVRDGDLQCGLEDLGRLFDQYPYLAVENLILMTDDGWHSVYFGKPYIYSLFAAPWAGAFGANGMVAFNMLMLLGMVWMGTAYLTRFNHPAVAALYAGGFFLLSTSFSYVFWLHPEIFNMACVFASLFLVLHRFDDGPGVGRLAAWKGKLLGPALRPAWSGGLLALAVYNKPMLAAVALPSLFSLWSRRERRAIATWSASALVSLVLVAGVSIVLTGHPTAYLGVERMGTPVFDPQQMPIEPVARPTAVESPTTNSWTWLLRVPEVDLGELTTHLGYFLWGRHTGLIPYMPFAVLSVVLCLLGGRVDLVRWLTLASIVAVALFFLVWIPFNWHGGGGFVGNRYFVNVYPAFLFLVARIWPAWLTAIGYAAGGLMLGPILFTPLGAPVPEPTLQAHVRNPPFRWLPLELVFRDRLPGYRGAAMSGAWFLGRKDVVEPKNDELLIHGATPVELWMFTPEPLEERVTFSIRNRAPGNRVKLDLAGHRTEIDFGAGGKSDEETRRLEVRPAQDPKRLREQKRWVYGYRLRVQTRTGFIANAARNAETKYPVNDFYTGIALAYLGTETELARDLYRVRWGQCDLPTEVSAGEPFEVTVRLTNDSRETWPSRGPTRVNLSYHWLDAQGGSVVREGRRTALRADVRPGDRIEIEQTVLAPGEPGRYRLELDLVRERVSWFSQKRPGAPCRAVVAVRPAAPTEGSPTP